MKPTIKEQMAKGISGLKSLLKRRPKKPKKVKPIKKNTWRRNLRALDLRLDRRQQQRAPIPVEIDDTERICSNCQTVYHGRVCPQCGQVGVWKRFTWRQAILNLLDIWGLGNRPMFRTLRDLFWRPGYMARDYLSGQRQYYFPPFKLLAIAVVFTLLVSMLPGVQIDSVFSHIAEMKIEDFEGFHPNGFFLTLFNSCVWFAGFLSQNMLYEWLFIGVIMVLCIRIGFRDVSKYNMVETYIFLIFMLSQNLILNIPNYIGHSLCQYIETHALSGANGALSPWAAGFLSVAGIVSFLYSLLYFFLILLDFRQFYGLKWKSVIWRIFLSIMVMNAVVVVIVVFLGLLIVDIDDQSKLNGVILLILMLLTAITAFVFAANYLKKNKTQVNKKVSRICKTAMLSVFISIAMGPRMLDKDYNLPSAISVMIICAISAVALSLLPVVLYKKFHRTWIAAIPLPLVFLLVITVNHLLSR